MTTILGISAFYHDSAAVLLRDGRIVAAAQEERFTRQKHDPAFPQHAIDYCLEEAGIEAADLDLVGFYEKPLLKFDRLLETYMAVAPRGYRSFLKALPVWLRQKLHLPREIRRGLRGDYKRRIVFPEHHESHAASAFFPSPFDEAAILTIDGVGEWATASMGTGSGNRIEVHRQLEFPHSLGLLYSAFTYFCGFRVNSGEYKLMGLAPYGDATYADRIRNDLLTVHDDGSLRLNMEYFNYLSGLTMTSAKFDELFDGPRRTPESPLTQREMDLAASVQEVTEEIVMKMAAELHRRTALPDLCLAGGVALNCVANGRLLREGPFQRIWIQPAAGDAGGALGTVWLIWHQLLNKPRETQAIDHQQGSLLGPRYTNEQIRESLGTNEAVYQEVLDEQQLCEQVAGHLSNEKVVGWFQGRMEFGPRALGARSILGDARSREMQSVMNLKIKFRESFRPFAPVVLSDHATEYFDLSLDQDSPYMLIVADVNSAQLVELSAHDQSRTGIDKLQNFRSNIPAVTHVDNSARIQTVDAVRNPRFHRLLTEFNRQTGCPVLINTSFNVRGEPIVCTPEDAYRCFMATNMDVLVMENIVLLKSEQPNAKNWPVDEHLAKFQLD